MSEIEEISSRIVEIFQTDYLPASEKLNECHKQIIFGLAQYLDDIVNNELNSKDCQLACLKANDSKFKKIISDYLDAQTAINQYQERVNALKSRLNALISEKKYLV